jgi:hypothetical protein
MRTDFERVFQEGYTLQRNFPDWCLELQSVTFSVIEIGSLKLTSGILIVQDPGLPTAFANRLKKRLKPGNYPVSLSLARLSPSRERTIACAKLEISDADPVWWEPAYFEKDARDLEHIPKDPACAGNMAASLFEASFDADGGTGCFMDFETAVFLMQKIHPLSEIVYTPGACNTPDFLVPLGNLFSDEVVTKMEKEERELVDGSIHHSSVLCGWADVHLRDIKVFSRTTTSEKTETPDANLIAFSTGWGEGDYISYWGYDEKDQVCCLVIDFALFDDDISFVD